MARREPTFFLLDRRGGRRTGHADGVAVDRDTGLALAAAPGGALALGAPAGSLGGLRPPRGLAVDDDGRVWLLDGTTVRRFEPARRRFQTVRGLGGPGHEPRRLRPPGDLCAAGRNLYVADTGNRRVQVFDRASLALVHLWKSPPAEAAGGPRWQPSAVIAAAGFAWVLDRSGGRVFRHRPGSERLHLVVEDPARADRYDGIAVDRAGRVHLLDADGGGPLLRVFGPGGEEIGTVRDPGEVRSRFAPPALTADHRGRFCVPESLARPCDPHAPADRPPASDPLADCRGRAGGLLFDRHGRPQWLDPEEPAGPPPHVRTGTWWSEALDSRIHRCQWHRVELELTNLPPGARVVVATLTTDRQLSFADLRAEAEERWRSAPVAVGALQPPPGKPDAAAAPAAPDRRELLVQSREGRYLWLRVRLAGDGFSTPAVDAVRIEFPRRSYLDFLPAIYSAEEESRWFLERFLSILAREWDALDHSVATIRRLFDPEAVPAGFVDYLASWLGLPLEAAWTAEQKQRLLSAAPGYYPRRGTLAALRIVLQVYLWNLTGVEPGQQGEIPAVAEGFRERQRLLLAAGDTSRLGAGAPLWSRAVVSRLQLGAFAREGEARLVSTGDPERDLFHLSAHRFRVFVPAPWVASDQDEAMLRRAIEAEKPAHTSYELCLVEPRLLVGVQSTAGFDSVLGDYADLRLGCAGGGTGKQRRPRQRLGIDAVLAAAPRTTDVLGTETWVGAGSRLA